MRFLAFVAVAGAVAVGACAEPAETADSELGGLVIAKDEAPRHVDVARAVADRAELGRAIAQSHQKALEILGPHRVAITSTTAVTEGGKPVDTLEVKTTIATASDGRFHALSDNSADYGEEIVFDGTALFLRPRYGGWHRRAPNTPAEPGALRDRMYGELAAAFDLVEPGAELTDAGTETVAGRAGRKVALRLSPSPAKPAAERLTQRAWRSMRTVEALTGVVVLDGASGIPLAATLDGTVGFVRDGRRYSMKTTVTYAVSDIGKDAAITVPTEDVVATPERAREVDDRDALLKDIAPPARAQPDVVRDSPAAGSAAPSKTK